MRETGKIIKDLEEEVIKEESEMRMQAITNREMIGVVHLVMIRMLMTGITKLNQNQKINVQISEDVEAEQETMDEDVGVGAEEKMNMIEDVTIEIEMYDKVHMEEMENVVHKQMKKIIEALIWIKEVIATIPRRHQILKQISIIILTKTKEHLAHRHQAEDVAKVETIVVDAVVVIAEAVVAEELAEEARKEVASTTKGTKLPRNMEFEMLN